MLLSKKEIIALVLSGQISFDPDIDSFQLQGNAIDLRLGYTFMVSKPTSVTNAGRVINVHDHLANGGLELEQIILEDYQKFVINPGEQILVTSKEKINLGRQVCGILLPRSSLNRRFLSLDCTGIIDANYSGKLIFPIQNRSNVPQYLVPGERIAQIGFMKLSSPVETVSNYNGLDPSDSLKVKASADEIKMLLEDKTIRNNFKIDWLEQYNK